MHVGDATRLRPQGPITDDKLRSSLTIRPVVRQGAHRGTAGLTACHALGVRVAQVIQRSPDTSIASVATVSLLWQRDGLGERPDRSGLARVVISVCDTA